MATSITVNATPNLVGGRATKKKKKDKKHRKDGERWGERELRKREHSGGDGRRKAPPPREAEEPLSALIRGPDEAEPHSHLSAMDETGSRRGKTGARPATDPKFSAASFVQSGGARGPERMLKGLLDGGEKPAAGARGGGEAEKEEETLLLAAGDDDEDFSHSERASTNKLMKTLLQSGGRG